MERRRHFTLFHVPSGYRTRPGIQQYKLPLKTSAMERGCRMSYHVEISMLMPCVIVHLLQQTASSTYLLLEISTHPLSGCTDRFCQLNQCRTVSNRHPSHPKVPRAFALVGRTQKVATTPRSRTFSPILTTSLYLKCCTFLIRENDVRDSRTVEPDASGCGDPSVP